MKKMKTFLIIVVVFALITLVTWMYAGYAYSWGPFGSLHNMKVRKMIGNSEEYSSKNVVRSDNNILENKNVLFLGSSVTYGAASLQEAMPEYFAKRLGCIVTKEAVSGTTLVDTGLDSYVSRLKRNVDTSTDYKLVICQLSTNDATQKKPMGELGDSFDIASFDTSTITGAMEYIIAYCKQNWNCPVMFYTGSRYDSEAYSLMVNRLYEISEKWGIGVLDLWSDDAFNNITDEERSLYMADPIHPTKAGYMKWWCPELERQLLEKY